MSKRPLALPTEKRKLKEKPGMTPNRKTITAMKEARKGGLKKWKPPRRKVLWWHVAFMIIPVGKQASDEKEVTMWVEAEASVNALEIACMQLEVEKGDLIHEVHVSPPRKTRPK